MSETGRPLRVYTLDGLPPEVVAVAFAKTSRVPDSFDEIASELSAADSSRFHEKWVIGYGHSSVAEHAVLSIAIENVSILGAKVVEENRLSSFTEKSTRYQAMDPDNYYTPPTFAGGSLGRVYRAAVSELFAAYQELLPAAECFAARKYGGPEWKERGVSAAGKACDAVRGLLPAAAKTNLGWTVNARSLAHGIVKMASHPLAEMQDLAAVLRRVCGERLPTLLKHTDSSPYLAGWEGRMAGGVAAALGPRRDRGPAETGARLVSYDPDGERAVLAALLFRASDRSYGEIRRALVEMDGRDVGVLLNRSLLEIGGHEAPVREFESTTYTFEIVCDFGAYRDIQRHRMTTQTQQLLGCELGYSVPDDAREAGLAGRMETVMSRAADAWRELADADPVHAQYVVPLAFHKRFLMAMNFREAWHFVGLRSRVQGHESYRRIAWAVKDEIARVHPALGALIPAERRRVAGAAPAARRA